MDVEDVKRSFEHKVVQHCAPTLAGVKPSSLFNFTCLEKSAAKEGLVHLPAAIDACRSKVEHAGVALSVLVERKTGTLVLVYRPDAIALVLEHAPSKDFLQSRSYDTSSAETCIESLRTRFEHYDCCKREANACLRCEFPHEVGLLLGYPYEDVMGFIANDGRGDICNGFWKVYGDEHSARNVFDCFKEHTRIFVDLFERGTPIEELVQLGRIA